MNIKLAKKAFLIEDLSGERYLTTDLSCGREDEWDHLYHEVIEGFYLPRDKEGNGYFLTNPESDWIETREFKPTERIVRAQDYKETIIDCLIVKAEDRAREIEEAKIRWMNYK